MEDFKDIVTVLDTKRPKKTPWKWSRSTFNKFNAQHPGRYQTVGEKKLIVKPLLKVEDLKAKPEAEKKKVKYKSK